MVQYFPCLLLSMVATMLPIMFVNRLKVAYPILSMLRGLAISFIPNVPAITLNPDLAPITFLSPSLYADVLSLSLKEMRKWCRIIFSFAFTVVSTTVATMVWVVNMVFLGSSLVLGFPLRGVVGSTDTVSASTIMKFVEVPGHISTIIESENLLGDASSLIVFRFAASVTTTGQLVRTDIALNFLWVIISGTLIGLAVAWVMRKLNKFFPTDANMNIILTFIAPYITYTITDEMGVSGALVVVAGGMYMSFHTASISATSIYNKTVAVWDILGFVLNGFVFMLIGLASPNVLESVEAGGMSLATAVNYESFITGVVIGVQLLSSYGALLIIQMMKHFIAAVDRQNLGFRLSLILGWAGMHGVLSLAVTPSTPLASENSEPFPRRSLILYIIFIVVLVTLLIQGFSLLAFIRWAKPPDHEDHIPEAKAEDPIRKSLAQAVLDYMQKHYKEGINDSFLLQNQKDIRQYRLDLSKNNTTPEERKKYTAISHHQRKVPHQPNKDPRINKERVRNLHQQLNLEEEEREVN